MTTAVKLPNRWSQLRWHPVQQEYFHCKRRNVLACAGRGSGKTEIARRKIVTQLRLKKPWPDPRYFYALPTYGQCRRVAREHILSLIPRTWLCKTPGDSQMEFKTVFGSWLFLVGLDVPARVEGDQYDMGVVDECSDQKPGVYARTLRPAMTHREGVLYRIGVPKRFGVGAGEFQSAFEAGLAQGDSFTWPSWDILPESEIAQLRRELSEKDFQEQVGGLWQDAGGKCYYAFSYDNVDDAVEYDKNKMIYVGSDFNVDPMAWVLAHKTPRGFHVFDEIWLRNTNTEQTLNTLWERYGEHRSGWLFTGDASGKQRKTSASSTDYAQIANDKRFKARVRYNDSNPGVRDRVASVNALCRNSEGLSELLINPRCSHLVEDLKKRALDEWGCPAPATPGQAHDSGHATDALGYLVWEYYPVKRAFAEGKSLIVVGGS